MPYAVTINSAVTFCSSVLLPETSKVICLFDLSKDISTLLTLTVALLLPQFVKPLVCRILPPRT